MSPTLVLAALVVAAPVPKALKRTDATALVGLWELTTATYGGQPYDSAVGTKWTLNADGSAVRDRPTDGVAKATYTLDPKADPKAFDWHTAEGNLFLGVYELDGDTFRLALRVSGDSGRPTKLSDTAGSYVFEFRRAKEQK